MAPVWQYDFGDVIALRVRCSHVSGLFMRHDMTAGPDVVRECQTACKSFQILVGNSVEKFPSQYVILLRFGRSSLECFT